VSWRAKKIENSEEENNATIIHHIKKPHRGIEFIAVIFFKDTIALKLRFKLCNFM